MHGQSDVVAEGLRELTIILVKGAGLVRLNIEHANDSVVEPQRNGQAALGVANTHDVTRILVHVRAYVASARRGDIPAYPASLGACQQLVAADLVGQTLRNKQLQTA